MKFIIQNLIKNLVTLMVNADYDKILIRKENGRLSKEEIETALTNYPGIITMPPDFAYSSIDIYEIYDEKTQARNIEFDLWYDNKVSDLTLEAAVHKKDTDEYCISIDDIRVL